MRQRYPSSLPILSLNEFIVLTRLDCALSNLEDAVYDLRTGIPAISGCFQQVNFVNNDRRVDVANIYRTVLLGFVVNSPDV